MGKGTHELFNIFLFFYNQELCLCLDFQKHIHPEKYLLDYKVYNHFP